MSALCEMTGLNRASFYRSRTPRRASPVEMEIRDEMQKIAVESPAYGYRRITAELGKRGFAINRGDAGLGVLAVGVFSKIRYGPRSLLFNCAVPGYFARPNDLLQKIGPALVQLVNMADRQVGLR